MFGRKKVVKSILLVFIILCASLCVPAISGKQVKNSIQKHEHQLEIKKESEQMMNKFLSEEEKQFFEKIFLLGNSSNLEVFSNIEINFSIIKLFRMVICAILYPPSLAMALFFLISINVAYYIFHIDDEQIISSLFFRFLYNCARPLWVVLNMYAYNFEKSFFEIWRIVYEKIWPPLPK